MHAQPAAGDATRDELNGDVQLLQAVLADSRVIEQAKGVLMTVYGVNAHAALQLLRCYSRAQRVKVRVLAARVTSVAHRRPTCAQMDSLLGAFDPSNEHQPV